MEIPYGTWKDGLYIETSQDWGWCTCILFMHASHSASKQDNRGTIRPLLDAFHTGMPQGRIYRQVSNIRRTLVSKLNCWPLRCSWSIACRRCSNYIFIFQLTLGFNILRKDYCKPRGETFKFFNLVRLILEILRYLHGHALGNQSTCSTTICTISTPHWSLLMSV